MKAKRSASLAAIGLAGALAISSLTTAQDTAPDPLPELGTILEPGRYVSNLVGPSIDLRVDSGWVVGVSGNGPIFTLESLEAPGAVLSVTRFDGETFLDSCDPTSMSLVEASVPRLTEIIGGNPFLSAGPPDVIEVDGYTGLRLDVGVPRYAPEECALPYLLLWAIPVGSGGEYVQVADQQSRFVILDVDGDVIVMAIESLPGVPFGGFLEASMEVLESMRIEPGEYEPLPDPAPAATQPPSEAEPGASASPEASDVAAASAGEAGTSA
jgi:hypothetical protein